MIDVTLLIKKEKRLGFAIKGHANFDQHGYDIVCAAVSILSYTAVNTLDYYKIDFDFSDDVQKAIPYTFQYEMNYLGKDKLDEETLKSKICRELPDFGKVELKNASKN